MTAAFSEPISLLTLSEAVVLVSWWKPLLYVPFFVAWAWLISTIYDKDAQRWYLKREAWNLGHIAAGTISFLALVLLPLPIFATMPIAVAILLIDASAYYIARNADDRVPETFKWSMNSLSEAAERRRLAKEAGNTGKVELTIQGPNGLIPAPAEDMPEYTVRVIAESLLTAVIEHRGSQMDIQPHKENVYIATMLVDGIRKAIRQMPAPEAVAAIDFIKYACGLDIDDRRRKQRGEFRYSTPEGTTTVTAGVTTQGSSKGMLLTMLVDPAGQVQMRLEELGLLKPQLDTMKEMVAENQGIVLLTAPADQGRTATMYAVLRAHDAYTSNVQTLEKEPQAMIEGTRTNEFGADGEEAEYHTTLRSILRRDPDVVGVAEVPDEATAKEATLADHERTRTYLSFKADDPLRALQLFSRMVGDEKRTSKSLHGVVTQRLMRLLCRTCLVGFQPTPEMLKKLGLPPETKQLYRKGGTIIEKDKEITCPSCAGGGYLGQIGAFAVHPIGKDERTHIASGDLKALKAMMREKRQMSIQQAALNHVLNGDTTVDEVVRVTQGEKKADPPKAPQTSGA